MSAATPPPSPGSGASRVLRRGLWERITTALIVAGLFMLMQPFLLVLYTYSFAVILGGTIGFAVASKLPE